MDASGSFDISSSSVRMQSPAQEASYLYVPVMRAAHTIQLLVTARNHYASLSEVQIYVGGQEIHNR